MTLHFWQQALNYNASMIKPANWTVENDLEFALKMHEDLFFRDVFFCKDQKIIPLKTKDMYYCDVEGNPNGTLTALSIGNSFSMNIVSAISTNPLFKRVVNVFGNASPFPAHDEVEAYLLDMVKNVKPDITFLVQYYYQEYLFNTSIPDIPAHKEFQHWNNIIKEIEKYTSAIIINKEQIIFPYDITQEYIRRKTNDLPIERILAISV